MSAKSIFIIIVTALVTIVLMKNTDEVSFWIFGEVQIPKLAILGTMFGLGLVVGFLAGRPKKKKETVEELYREHDQLPDERHSSLSDEDREYIN